MKRAKKLWSVLLVLVMVLGMIPAAAPGAQAIRIAAHRGMNFISLIVMMPERLIIAPTEKSMPPQMIAIVTPKAMISRIAAELSISMRLYFV